MKIPPMEAELYFADGRSDMKKIIFALCNVADTP